jgi:hypothetical protein
MLEFETTNDFEETGHLSPVGDLQADRRNRQGVYAPQSFLPQARQAYSHSPPESLI